MNLKRKVFFFSAFRDSFGFCPRAGLRLMSYTNFPFKTKKLESRVKQPGEMGFLLQGSGNQR